MYAVIYWIFPIIRRPPQMEPPQMEPHACVRIERLLFQYNHRNLDSIDIVCILSNLQWGLWTFSEHRSNLEYMSIPTFLNELWCEKVDLQSRKYGTPHCNHLQQVVKVFNNAILNFSTAQCVIIVLRSTPI